MYGITTWYKWIPPSISIMPNYLWQWPRWRRGRPFHGAWRPSWGYRRKRCSLCSCLCCTPRDRSWPARWIRSARRRSGPADLTGSRGTRRGSKGRQGTRSRLANGGSFWMIFSLFFLTSFVSHFYRVFIVIVSMDCEWGEWYTNP